MPTKGDVDKKIKGRREVRKWWRVLSMLFYNYNHLCPAPWVRSEIQAYALRTLLSESLPQLAVTWAQHWDSGGLPARQAVLSRLCYISCGPL